MNYIENKVVLEYNSQIYKTLCILKIFQFLFYFSGLITVTLLYSNVSIPILLLQALLSWLSIAYYITKISLWVGITFGILYFLNAFIISYAIQKLDKIFMESMQYLKEQIEPEYNKHIIDGVTIQ